MLLPLALIGLIVLLPISVRLALWGRHRALPRNWLAWLPLGAPLVWLAGTGGTLTVAGSRASNLRALSPPDRAAAMSEGIAEALQLTLAGAIAAIVLLAGCFALFSFCRRLAEPASE